MTLGESIYTCEKKLGCNFKFILIGSRFVSEIRKAVQTKHKKSLCLFQVYLHFVVGSEAKYLFFLSSRHRKQ